MPTCPVCGEDQNADDKAFEHHVNAHFDGGGFAGPSRPASSSSLRDSPMAMDGGNEGTLDTCPICSFPLSYLTPAESSTHLNSCLDTTSDPRSSKEQQDVDSADSHQFEDDYEIYDMEDDYDYANMESQRRADEDWKVEEEWDGPAKPGGWTDWVGKKVDKGDKWWDPISGTTKASDVPNNFSPGVVSVLASTLRNAAHQSITRRAVLSRDTVHIKGVWAFDMGWGCGYRNALMCLSALLSIPAYRPLFAREHNGAEPGVRRVQGWLEEAWKEGYDPEGRAQLKGKVLGTRKWIGPSDLYAMFTYKGIPCEIYDFPKPVEGKSSLRTAHIALQQWVKAYFSEEDNEKHPQDRSAFDVLMRSGDGGAGRGDAVRVSNKFPLILQHFGHSRTIIGYEENGRGDVNLLLLDPGRTMPKDIRSAGLVELVTQRAKAPPPQAETAPAPVPPPPHGMLRKRSSQTTHEAMPFSPPFTNGRAEIVETDSPDLSSDHNGLNHPRGGGTGGDSFVLSDEEITPSGWVRKKMKKNSSGGGVTTTTSLSTTKTLNYFRVNLGGLSKYTQYQVLAFTGGEVLSRAERERRKEIRSTVVRA
ncbi:hypothetical protein CI109_104015 [Kwoniella shandongensis]|uniref:UFSP1/2/DUB catalytic domain-containing protein n=1 Tax=Kwoniella shandongensis TaxID=1734106 RepID=A0A5M6BYU5_9TREE|nr:uncharacterized protein CI109_004100 [Kwoniella shandongensis]KAA5527561.1 hypothetical protein CI109_004100 [Kwoniella shandongensis]